jgi:hypothetical protein
MRKPIFVLVMIAAAGSQLGNTDCGQALRDPGFDLWCDGQLCAWSVERGEVAQVPTWIDGDSGVSLVGSDTAIEQLSPVTSHDGTCLEFDLVTNIDDDAEVVLNVDLDGDGSIDTSQRLLTAAWKPQSFKLPITAPFDGVRFELVKSGTGTAVLAQIGATVVSDCGGLPTITGGGEPLGAQCGSDADCASAMCRATNDPDAGGTAMLCVGCDGTTACGAHMVCGLGEPLTPLHYLPTECVFAGLSGLGESCSVDAQCVSGTCTFGSCSLCTGNTDPTCPDTCAPAWTTFDGVYAPWVCGGKLGAGDAECASDADCQSPGTCEGDVRSQCSDGRACTTDADCPIGGDLKPGTCTVVGIQGGRCL